MQCPFPSVSLKSSHFSFIPLLSSDIIALLGVLSRENFGNLNLTCLLRIQIKSQESFARVVVALIRDFHIR